MSPHFLSLEFKKIKNEVEKEWKTHPHPASKFMLLKPSLSQITHRR